MQWMVADLGQLVFHARVDCGVWNGEGKKAGKL